MDTGKDTKKGGETSSLPEVGLVHDIVSCRDCTWFWGSNKPYGPYPGYDFTSDFPPELGDIRTEPRPYFAQCAGPQYIVPAILSGCRKAPIMTIGINPNLTAFRPCGNNATWCYPFLKNDARYAYYYRYHSLCQESMPPGFIAEHVSKDRQLVAQAPGYIAKVDRAFVGRQLTITIHYIDERETTQAIQWSPDEDFILLFDVSRDQKQQFVAGDMIGGYLSVPKSAPVEIKRNPVGYYLRFVPILASFSTFLRSQGLKPKLRIAEDVSQLDMVACASPGWVDKYCLDKEEIIRKCVHTNRWAVRQLLHAQPRVIVFSGLSAFKMFDAVYGGNISPCIDVKEDVFGVMTDTVRRPRYLEIDEDSDGTRVRFRARVVVTPHFSYSDSFEPESRYSLERWQEFQKEFPEAYKELVDQNRVEPPNEDGFTAVKVMNLGDFQMRHKDAVPSLLSHLYEPSSMVADVLKQEFILGNLSFNRRTWKLNRTPGACRFCANDQWKFPLGCSYA